MSEEKNVPKLRFPGFTEPWEQRKLGEYVSITSGEAPSKFEVGTELYVKVDDLNYNDKYVVDTQNKVAEHSTVKRVTKGSVVFPKRGAAIMTNKVRIMGIDGYMDTNMMALTSEKLDSEFLYNIISKEGLYKIADTSTIPQINNKHVEPYEVTIPSLDEQRKIGAYFKQLDHLITLHQRKLGHVKDLKKSMLQKMFPKNGELYPEVRFPGFTAAWEQRKLGEVFEQTANFVNPNEKEIELWSLTVEDGLTSKTERYNREFLVKKDNNFKEVRPGEIVYNPMNMTLGAVGYNGMAKSVAVSGYYTTMITKKGHDSYYINTWLKSPQAISLYKTFATGSLIEKQRVQFSTLSIIPATFPEYEEQAKIGQYFSNLDHLITLHQRELDHLQLLKKGMLQQMFV
jgi:type I restriction enzyme S subunit